MHYYVYDTFLADKKYEKALDKIKAKLLDLEIQGRHEKLTLLKSIDELVSDEVRKGTNTVVVLGNDRSLLKVVNVAAKSNITLGMIPFGEGCEMARALGLPDGGDACEILAARKVVKFDLGKIRDQYFLTTAVINKNLTRLSIGKSGYRIIPRAECSEVEICNFYFPKKDEIPDDAYAKSSINDKKLELMFKVPIKSDGWLRTKILGQKIDSMFQGDVFDIKSFEYLPIVLDGYKIIKTPVNVEIAPGKLSLIVGKDRISQIQ
jgi:diacylglycerol kinase family enzyme